MLNQKGFTLIEIAIVLVVIGLLIGGVLKAQGMITNTKIKRIQRDNAGIAAAMYSYQDRYRQLPGDDSRAANRFGVYVPADPVDGDRSGTIDGVWNIAATNDVTLAATAETNLFYAHLRAAGLIAGGGTDDTKPSNAFGGQIGIQSGSLGIAGHVFIFGAIEGPIARIIEARFDDGAPDTGRLQAGLVANAMVPGGVAEVSYDDNSRYNLAFRP